MSVLRVRPIVLCGAIVLLGATAAAHAVNLAGAADADRLGNLVLAMCAITVAVAFLFPVARGWRARPRRSDATGVDDTTGRLVRRVVPGLVVAMVDSDSLSFDARGRAGRGAPELDETTCFEIGSVTKTFTALVLADMVERGEVTLDERLARFVPEHDPESPITLLDLATHTAGLPRLPPNTRLWLGLWSPIPTRTGV